MKKVLVTGATGFVGRHTLQPLVARGFEVHAVARTPRTKMFGENITWHAADLLAPGTSGQVIERVQPTHLLHLAWCADPANFWNTPENHYWLKATEQLIHAFTANNGRRFVGAGSCAEYEWQDDTNCNEACSSTQPFSLYGETKLAAGRLLETIGRTDEVTTAWGRLFFAYGPWGHVSRLPAAVITPLSRGLPAKCSSGVQQRDYIFIEDAANAFVSLLDSDVTGPVNIASGRSIPLIELLRGVAKELNSEHLLEVGAIPDTPINNPQRIAADVSRLRDEVQFESKVSLDDGIRLTVDWWKQQLAKRAA